MSKPRTTSPFYTFDPIIRDPEDLIPAIRLSKDGDHGKFLDLVSEDLGMPKLIDGVGASLDSATILLISLIEWQKGERAAKPLDSGISRDRIGRFPSIDGNAIEYLIKYTKEGNDSSFHYLLKLLSRRFDDYYGDYREISSGMSGVDLLGWLNEDEILEMKKEIETGVWSIDSGEELDGGVQDCVRHLLVILRSAIKRKCGILMRRHV